jgi:hypothetical protein
MRTATAQRLFLFSVLLGAGFVLARSFPTAWRRAAAAALVAAFALWPFWAALAARNDGNAAQVDVVVQADAGPLLVWSAVALRSAVRRPLQVDVVDGSWGLEQTDQTGRLVVSDDPSFEAVRGGEMELTWRADVLSDRRLDATVHSGDATWTAEIVNAHDVSWTDAWLLVPGAEPVRVDDLQPGASRTLRGSAAPWDGSPATRLALGLSPARLRLARNALDGPVATLLERGRPVVVAWTAGPVLPARLGRDQSLGSGATLIVAAARLAS